MFKLIKLEFEKTNLTGYVVKALITMIIVFGMVSGMALMSKSHHDPMFIDITSFMSLVNIFIRITFVVFSGILISRLIIEEYKSKTIQQLFTYPIQRKKVIQAKLMIIFGFCFFGVALSTIAIELFTVLLNPIVKFFETPVTISVLFITIPSILIASAMTAGLSLIALFFGMRKKSTATTITCSVIIGVLLNAMVSDGSRSVSIFDIMTIPTVLCFLGLFIAYLSYRKIDRIDVA
ncbi:ABC transporter permease [Paenibacillus sp. GSMTC-2017]|uniref:ABC transporter permease n=1 Tax=Paenibacillus sp. GSMTC-2017 TaxID=2794350 RepID=UPI0018D5BA68|nr:ABC transporter permease [Paenibacillus sp. GSMTC-2017]MBH5318044.1 ABC transporter permease [Paenibacillus sp. GSMTC-2017]